ncbi:MAG: hypothetical protein IGS39_12255 [Calothrix sp. C42_A2020_038]|nr:hypothetical protein [Calothrix sp. C42_A2020_038]
MKKYLGFAKRLLVLATPVIASSLVATTPARAATFALSEAQFVLSNFSINPEDVLVDTETFSNAISFSGQPGASADANAEALFFPIEGDPKKSVAFNLSESIAIGSRTDDFAIAESTATIAGFSFLVPKGGTFSFDFDGLLNLATFIHNSSLGSAVADGIIALTIFEENSDTLLDFIFVDGQIATSGGEDFLTLSNSDNFFFTRQSLTKLFGGNEEFAQADLAGRYSRTFAEPTRLRLEEVKFNRALVKVPDNTNGLILMIAGGMMFVLTKTRVFKFLISANRD